MRRPIGFTVLAVFAAWYSVACFMLAIRAIERAGVAQWLTVALLAVVAAAAGAATAVGVWRMRAWAAGAVGTWGTLVILTFAALFFAVDAPPGRPRPWAALAAGSALFGLTTWGLARYVRLRTPAAPAA